MKPGGKAEPLREAVAEQREQGRRSIDQSEAQQRAEQRQRIVAELGIGGTGDHVGDRAPIIIGANALRAVGEAEPDRPLLLEPRPNAQSSISASRIAAMPPARSSASRRTSMQPPAAAAVRPDRSRGRTDRASGRRTRRPVPARARRASRSAASPSARRAPARSAPPAPPASATSPAHGRCRHRSATGNAARRRR